MTQKDYEDGIVDAFVVKMKEKLDKHRHNHPTSWGPDDEEFIVESMNDAYDDGDMVSVANYAMMLDNIRSN